MPKRYFLAALSLALFSFVLAAQAQDAPQPTQSVADAVSTLLAQTQQAPTQVYLTQTVQAALEAALTATAQAATPVPLDAASAEVVNTSEFELVAGFGNNAVYLAPNGTRLIHGDGRRFCLYQQGSTDPRCVDLPSGVFIDLESIRWSPDSRYIVFNENFLIRLIDADIWVWDTTTDEVSNLTDDGENRIRIEEDNWSSIDLAPNWLPDGRIIFLRYSRVSGEIVPPEILALDRQGGEPERWGTLENSGTFAVTALEATEDRLFYNYFAGNREGENGVWMSSLDGSEAKQIIQSGEDFPPYNIDVSPDGRYALINLAYSRRGNERELTPEASPVRLIDLQQRSQQLIDPNQFVSGAGWSPDGTALAYLVNNWVMEDASTNGLYITATPGEVGRQVLEGSFIVPTPLQNQSLMWGANHYLLLSNAPEEGITLVELGS